MVEHLTLTCAHNLAQTCSPLPRAVHGQVSQAARYIVDRFGVAVETEEDLFGVEGQEHTTMEALPEGPEGYGSEYGTLILHFVSAKASEHHV